MQVGHIGRGASIGFIVVCMLGAGASPRAACAHSIDLRQAVSHPTDCRRIVLRHEGVGGGLFSTRDGGRSWQLLCGNAIEEPLPGGDVLAMAADGSLHLTGYDGLRSAGADGCGWVREPQLEGRWVTDVVAHPGDPAVLFALTSPVPSLGTDGGLYRRDGSGLWSPLGSRSALLLTRVRAVETSEGLRFYQSALRSEPTPDGSADYLLRYSDDDAESWTEYAYGPAQRQMRLEAVDPTDPDRIVVSLVDDIGGPEGDSLMVSIDRGRTFREYLRPIRFAGIAFASDGRVWIADAGDAFDVANAPGGLWFAESLDATPVRVVDARSVRCVEHRQDGSLLLCGVSGAYRFDPSSFALRTIFDLADVDGFVACGGVDVAERCRDQLVVGYCSAGFFPSSPVCASYDLGLSDETAAPASPDRGDVYDCADPEGGTTDAGTADASATDASPTDTSPTDVSPTDAGEADASSPRASAPFDAGVPRAQARRTTNTARQLPRSSGGCRAGPRLRSSRQPWGTVLAVLVLGAGAFRWRRRTRGRLVSNARRLARGGLRGRTLRWPPRRH